MARQRLACLHVHGLAMTCRAPCELDSPALVLSITFSGGVLQERSAALRAIAEAETAAALRAEANAQRETGEEEQSPEQASVRISHMQLGQVRTGLSVALNNRL